MEKTADGNLDFYYSVPRLFRLIAWAVVLLGLSMLATKSLEDYYGLVAVGLVAEFVCTVYLVFLVIYLVFMRKVVILNNRYIKIERASQVFWEDIEYMHYAEVRIGLIKKSPLLFVKLADEKKYHLNFIQKMAHFVGFAPFSIPLYVFQPEERKLLLAELVKFTKILKDENGKEPAEISTKAQKKSSSAVKKQDKKVLADDTKAVAEAMPKKKTSAVKKRKATKTTAKKKTATKKKAPAKVAKS